MYIALFWHRLVRHQKLYSFSCNTIAMPMDKCTRKFLEKLNYNSEIPRLQKLLFRSMNRLNLNTLYVILNTYKYF